MLTSKEYSDLINRAINSLNLPDGKLAGLYSPISYALASGGKRLRPMLTLMACEAFGHPVEEALPIAVGIEMFHNFTLLHDDVMDNSATRRGRPSVMAKYGVNTAILSGDTMLSLATGLMLKAPASAVPAVMECFNSTAIEVYEGQQLDIDFENRKDVSLSEYLEMIRLKTSVLLGCAAKIGAIVASASEDDADMLYRYAECLGLAFQIQDDMLDVYGNPDFGKPIGGDILNDKKTFLMLSAMDSPKATELRNAMALSDGSSKIKAVTEVYDSLNMRLLCSEAVERYSREAISAIENVNISEESKECFRKLAYSLSERKV